MARRILTARSLLHKGSIELGIELPSFSSSESWNTSGFYTFFNHCPYVDFFTSITELMFIRSGPGLGTIFAKTM